MNIEIFNQTSETIDKELKELKDLLRKVVIDLNLKSGEFNIIVVDNGKIKELNKEYRNKDCNTDVISFALEDDKTFNIEDHRILGDIYISLDKTRSQAEEYGHTFKRELSFLAIHGLLHLLGYDHIEKKEEEIMFNLQEEVLSKYEITR